MAGVNCGELPHLSANDESTLNSIFNPHLPYDPEINQRVLEDEEDTSPDGVEAKEFEVKGVEAAESGDVLSALSFFNQAIEIAPNRASSYNNRAQALRLKDDVPGARQDLDKAIELSRNKGKTACQAYTQRGLLEKLEGNDEAALADFKKAAALGGSFAREMCVAMNPYAALCSNMLSEMFAKVQQGEM